MANSYGYMAKIGLKDDGVQKGLTEINGYLNEIDRAISSTDKAIKNAAKSGRNTTELWGQQYELLNTQIETTSEKLSALESVQKKVEEAYENGAIDYSVYINFQNEIANTASQLENLKTRAEQAQAAMSPVNTSETFYQNIEAHLDEVNERYEKSVAELSEVDKALKQSGQSEELLAQKSTLLGEAVNAAQVKLALLTEEQEAMNRAVKDGSTSAEEYRAFQREIANTEAELEKLTREQENLGKETEDTTGKAATFGDVLKANVISDAIAKGIDALTDAFKKLGDELKDIAEQTAVYGDTVDKQSQRLGMTEKSYQEWTYILSQNGADISSLTAGMRTLTNAVDNAKNGASAATTAFGKLGISVEDLNGLTGEEQFSLVVTGLQKMSDETERNAVANDLLGRSYQTLIPLLNQDADSVEKLRQKANDTNQILSEDGVTAAVNYTDAVDTLNKSLQGFRNQLGAEVLPVLTELIEEITEIINTTEKDDIDELINDIADAAKSLIDIVKDFVDSGGIEKIIDVLEWILMHGDEIIDVLETLGAAWAIDKAAKFGSSLAELPGQINNVLSVVGSLTGNINNFGNALNTAAGAASSMSVSLSGWIAIAALAIKIATNIASAIDEAADRLNDHSEAVNQLDDEYTELNKTLEDFIELKKESIELANTEAGENIADAKATAQSYRSQIDTLEKLIEKNREYYGTNDLRGYELYNFDQSGNKVSSAGAFDEITDQLGSLYHDFYAANDIVQTYEDTLAEAADNSVKYVGMTEEAAQNSIKNLGKTSGDIAREIEDKKVSEQEEILKTNLSELEHKLAVNKLTEDEYYKQLKELLDGSSSWLKNDSEVWHSYNNKYLDYIDKNTEEIKEEITEDSEDIGETLEESVKKSWKQAERTQQEKGYDDKWLLSEYRKILDTLDEGSDLYLEYYDKWLKLRNDIKDDDLKQWEDSAKETADAVKQAYEDVNKAQEEAQKDYLKTGSSLGETVTEKGGKERFVLNDLDEESNKLKKYRESMEKLKATGISDDLLSGVMEFDYKDGSRQQFIDELLGMTEKQRQQYYKDYGEYMEEVRKTGEYDVQDQLEEANKIAADGVTEIYSSMPESAYKQGKETADSYIQGIIDGMSNYDPLTSGAFADVLNGSTARTESEKLYSGQTVINFMVDSQTVVSKTIDELTRSYRRGGNPLNA